MTAGPGRSPEVGAEVHPEERRFEERIRPHRLDEMVGGGVSVAANMAAAARMIAAAALLRTESRGGHFRTDFPESVPWWNRPVIVNP